GPTRAEAQTEVNPGRVLQLSQLLSARNLSRWQLGDHRDRARRLGPADLPRRFVALSRRRERRLFGSVDSIRPRYRGEVVARRALDCLPLPAQGVRGEIRRLR